MKPLFSWVIICLCFSSFGQTEAQKFKSKQLNNKFLLNTELKAKLVRLDFSSLFTHTGNSAVYGFIGNNYQRIKIKFISAVKSDSLNDTYTIYGKSMVGTNICDFTGSIVISNIRKYKLTNYGVDDEYKNKVIEGEYTIVGEYSFFENQGQRNSGNFNGVFETNFYLDKQNHPNYDDIELNADGFTNNEFVGQWMGYKSKMVKRCNWGDFRIPNSGDLDIGAGEFSPNEKYLKFGWQTLRNLTISQSDKSAKEAEDAEWWK